MSSKSPLPGIVGALLLWPSLVFAQQGSDGFRGEGAALCIAAGEILSRQPKAAPSIQESVMAWRQILHVMDGTEARRQAALEQARDAMGRPGAARMVWPLACATREMQIKYLVVHGSKDRTQNNLAEGPGSDLGAEAAQRLNASAACLAAAELFRKPPQRLRLAWKDVSPPPPDSGTLRAMQQRLLEEIDNAPGSTVGKALVVDYFRYLVTTASSGSAPQRFLNQTSQRLHDQCLARAGSH